MNVSLKDRWIFIAEDEAMIALDLCAAFEGAGAKVEAAFSLRQAMGLVGTRTWAGAVLDFALSDDVCTPLCHWFMERQIPFVICSGYDEVGAPCDLGVRLLKPVTSGEVVETMAALVAA